MNKSLAIISVVYENYDVLFDFLKSFKSQANSSFHIFLADLSESKKKIKNILPLTVINSKNKGYAYGVNICLKKALKQGFDQFCVINSDAYVDKKFVQNTLLSLEKYPNSIIGGKIYYAPGYEFHKNRYKKNELGKVLWYAGGFVDWKNVLTPHRGVDEVDQGQYDKLEKTDFITGCLMCFDKNIIDKIGFWNEKYFLYYEDADYCMRAKQKGINLYYNPSIIIWHKNAQSTQGSGSTLHIKYQEKSRLLFGLKYAPLRTKIHLVKNYFLIQWKKYLIY